MYEKAKDLAEAYVARRLSRRAFIDRMAKLGIGAAAARWALSEATTRALAADYDWQKHKGKTVTLLLNKHPYTDAMIADLDSFKKLTGMDVKYDVFPEDVYFDKVTAALSSRSTQYDAFMTGAYQTWQYGPAGWLVDMNEYIGQAAPNYNWNDVLPNLRASTAWSGVPGAPLGGAGAKQWALPWGFELNSVSYNKRVFDKLGMTPPENLPDMKDKAAKITKDVDGMYGIGVRGSRSWATIHPGYLSGFTNYGAHDFEMVDGKLKAAMNSAAGKQFTELWVAMIKQSGPRNWSTYTWYEVGNDLGAGASGMIFDADILGYFMNGGTKEAGNIAYSAFAAKPGAKQPTPNVWIWSLAMNNFSKQKEAAWYWMQWATSQEHDLFGARKMDFVNPVRQSVWDDETFRDRIAKSYPGYLEQYEASAPGSKIYFTPQPLFFNLTTEWAASLQKMVADEVPVDEGLDQLAESVNRQLASAGLR
ncbi:carbohydrate ABC transporter substrate-binding protein, CUT1 family [Tistlia consotensis]|uniref:Carbohydrate ABC transporter substrate-binding protein, CUT1 family n=1 Tax=Tistlia consotensis USBA 355 TaxID=560819 RepID=A0A1Y6BRK2_9PROT|nr:extracellular solute-binding protein [Tistlia consotensis]SMF21869.1 carbohydrate ABC transporter substrate-binding protein, CUT1 family [Tistlia consotensis USBA 355]SNR46499.1 carbohydrate ABC transporter substrate-binding protein, CUT1 family [Tistlia consotensis]